MALSHQGMGITKGRLDPLHRNRGRVAGDMGVGSQEGGEVMTFLESLKVDIVMA